MKRFVHRQNLLRYIEQLEDDIDTAKRERLQDLLIEEVNHFGTWRERVSEANELITRGNVRLRQQERLVAQLAGEGKNTDMAERLIANMTQTLQVFRQFREALDADRQGDLA